MVELHHAGAVLELERGVRLKYDDEGEEDADPLSHAEEYVEQVTDEGQGSALGIGNLVRAKPRQG